MLKEIINTNDLIISFDKDNKIMLIKWTESCGNILDEKYLPVLEKIKQKINEKSPEKLLADMQECDYHLTPASGSWFDIPVFSFYTNLSVRRIALVVPGNMWVTAAFDAYRASEALEPDTKVQYFGEREKAWAWLNK